MISLLKNVCRILSPFNSNQKDENSDSISLEALNTKIRIGIWLFLVIHVTINTFSSPTRLPTLFYIFVYIVLGSFLWLLIRCKNELLKGIPFVILNLGAALAIAQKGEDYYLRLITFSLASLPILSVQGYSPLLLLALGAGHFWIYKHYNSFLEAFYEPVTASYRIPAISIENTVNGWRVGLVFEIVCLIMYQIVVQRLWKNYKKAKLNLEEANQKLQSVNLQLAKNVEELGRLNSQLQNALHSQDLFVACVSHELRNPLNVMLGSLDLLEPHIKDTNQLQILKTCRVCGDALLSQINNLLDVAKINADKLEISEFATNIGVFLEKFWAYTRISLDKKKLTGHLAVDRNLPLWLSIDEHRLQQILNNLMGNAIKFTTEGSVRIKLNWVKENDLAAKSLCDEKITEEGPNQHIAKHRVREDSAERTDTTEGKRQDTYCSQHRHRKQVKTDFLCFKPDQSVRDDLEATLYNSDETLNNFLKIDIVDTGCGMSEEVQQKIFEPFVQGDRSVTRKYGGTGLGLYIVKCLVNKMGGSIKINSLKEVGTHFQIILPAKSVKKEVQTFKERDTSLVANTKLTRTVSERITPQGNTFSREFSSSQQLITSVRRVLIIDDDVFNQNLLREYFKKLNFESDVANNGLEGLQIYKNNPQKYKFMTMDIQMPFMDGITASRQIRAFEAEVGKSRIPIIIITGNCSEAERRECLENKEIGANYFFRKPFGLSDCKLCVEKIVAGH